MRAALRPLLCAAWLLAAALLQGGCNSQTSPHPDTVSAAAPIRPAELRYLRPLTVSAMPAGQPPTACAVLDPTVFEHANPTLTDLRVFTRESATGQPAPVEVPFVLTTSQTAANGDSAQVLNLGLAGDHLSFDLAMPPRPYTDVDLALSGTDFIATAKVYAMGQPGFARNIGPTAPVNLGTYTLFDLTSQHLGRATRLPLQEGTLPYLHVDLAVTGAPGHPFTASQAMVEGAQIPPSREAETLYTTVAETDAITQDGRQTLATFNLPAHIPVEQVQFLLAGPDKRNFSRSVRILARSIPPRGSTAVSIPEVIDGSISRVRTTELGHEIHLEQLTVPATLGAGGRRPVRVEVSIDNGDDRPIALQAVRLAMRQRKLCFEIPAAPAALYYGAETMRAPVYDFGRFFEPAAPARLATLGLEQPNVNYKPQPAPARPFTERHPSVLWLALVAAIAILGGVAFRSARRL